MNTQSLFLLSKPASMQSHWLVTSSLSQFASRKRNLFYDSSKISSTCVEFPRFSLHKRERISRFHGRTNCINHSFGRLFQFEAPAIPLSRTYGYIRPFIEKERFTIIKAWLCTLVSVGSLYVAVPRLGQIPGLLSTADLKVLGRSSILTLSLLILRSVAHYFQEAWLWEAALNTAFGIRSSIFQKVLNRDMSYFESTTGVLTGDIAYRLTAEARDTADTVYAFLHTIVPNMLQLTIMAFRMFSLSHILTLTTMLIFPCITLSIAYLGEKLRRISRMGQNSIAALSSFLNEVLPSMMLVKAYSAEDYEIWRFNDLANVDRQRYLSKKMMKAFIPEVVAVIYSGAATILVCMASWVKACGIADGACLVSFVTSLILLIQPIQDLGKAYNELKQGEPSIERLFELATLYSGEEVFPNEGKLFVDSVTGDVTFHNVSFQYSQSQPVVLRNMNWHVKAGESVAIVGPSGGGKTTIAKLLLRLYDPSDGNILIDGYDIKSMHLKSLRKCMAFVPQDASLFSGTVAENIAYGELPDRIDMKKVESAAKLANADSFIKMLPKGYTTNIGQRGSIFSGGQRQRLAIARAIYHEAAIYILDEATSALDNTSESLVRDALELLMANHTVFIIAHRLETIRKADRIFFIDGGRLVEEGNHSCLLAQGGYYARMYATQEHQRDQRF